MLIYCYHYLYFRLLLFSDIKVSQGSVATLLRCGGTFKKMRDKIAEVENAGKENAAQDCRGGKCRNGKCRTRLQG